jgi:hypothetical protein
MRMTPEPSLMATRPPGLATMLTPSALSVTSPAAAFARIGLCAATSSAPAAKVAPRKPRRVNPLASSVPFVIRISFDRDNAH